MSSYLQKNPLIDDDRIIEKEVLLPCPECGELTMERVQRDCTLKDNTFIANLPHFYCSSCESKFYDDVSMNIIESHRTKPEK
jgi:YgiT-type zinc finger domain-containing protein